MDPIQTDEGTLIRVTEEQAQIGLVALDGMERALKGYAMTLLPGSSAQRDLAQTRGIIAALRRRLAEVKRQAPDA